MTVDLAVGFVFSLLIGFGGYSQKALSKSGFAGAVVVGTAIFGWGGWHWGVILIAFFVSSSGLSFLKSGDKIKVAEKFEKGSRRDMWQTFANGGMGALAALLSAALPGAGWWFAFVGAMATVTADTWATELGVLSKRPPRLITSGQTVSPGTSGGITAMGTAAAAAGGIFIGGVAWGAAWARQAFGPTPNLAASAWLIPLAASAGLIGALADSLLGAVWQAMYVCPVCARHTEQRHHRPCRNAPTRLTRGIRGLNNDGVNFISSLFGASTAVIAGLVWQTFS
ncbi:MAG: TIGR00297 family protein [Anaerolineae bacterium]